MTRDASYYTILVEFDLKPGCRTAFMPLMLENARSSLSDEPGCLVFDVLSRADDEERVVLYEVYRDKSAFDAHLRAPHFLSFDAAIGDYVAAKRVIELSMESPPSAVTM
ncbi:putative quinol monooxygenase [Aquamicrobium sp. LC103]|uniref:putative quinol monooxygenase n=1 Tax=Aquamicrobium sp. LC103 TaxID=1120658 RepID=UPI00063EAA86|nr:putative quinol monooxygenase [Aquamicrobium sp. LC103]TKT69838.1 antibiotic biosynthesis monooxygenase [Aquamicrobium sp. LC103]